jgi:hypothetical protein
MEFLCESHCHRCNIDVLIIMNLELMCILDMAALSRNNRHSMLTGILQHGKIVLLFWFCFRLHAYIQTDRTLFRRLVLCAVAAAAAAAAAAALCYQATPLLPMNAEFGMPPWLFGMHSYEVLAGGSSILAVYSDPAAAGAAHCSCWAPAVACTFEREGQCAGGCQADSYLQHNRTRLEGGDNGVGGAARGIPRGGGVMRDICSTA